MELALEALSVTERGLVVGLALAGAEPQLAERLRGVDGARCRRALDALAAAPPVARQQALAELARTLCPPIPPGMEKIHPGWFRRALEREAAEVVAAVVAGLPAEVARVADELTGGPDGDGTAAAPAWRQQAIDDLRRFFFGSLVPMPTQVDDRAVSPRARALCALPMAALLEELDRRGAEVLGRSLAGAPVDVIARAAVGLGPPLGRVVSQVAAEVSQVAAEAGRRGAAGVVGAARGEQELLGAARAIGLRAVAREIVPEGWEAAQVVAQRLPPAVGDVLLDVVAAEACALWEAGEGD